MNLGSIAVFSTAFRRPPYLRQTLDAWSRARGIAGIGSFTVALDWHPDAFAGNIEVAEAARAALGCPLRIRVDSSAARASRSVDRAIGEAVSSLFADPAVEFVIAGEEDVAVSDDVLEYMAWAAGEFADDRRVLTVCAHSQAGQGWDVPGAGPREDPDADPGAVRLVPYFNPWVWGTWRDRWERALRPRWDWDCSSGGAMDSGYDWNICRRIIPQGNYVSVVPLASRSQNIGRDGGWAAEPAQFEGTQAASFREHREPCSYRVSEDVRTGSAANRPFAVASQELP